MRRQTTAFVTALLLVVAAAAVPIPGLAQSDGTATATATPTSDESTVNETDVAPGELLQGVIGVQEAELEGEIRTRTFGIRVARAATDEARAEVVAEELNESAERLNELERRRERLRQRLEAGNISRGEYRAEMAKLAAETATVRTVANQSANVSAGLPAEMLDRKGINATAIRMLSERANELTGPEVSRIARTIAGPRVGVGRGPPANASERGGPPANASERGGPPANASERGGADDRSDSGNRTETAGSGDQAEDGSTASDGGDGSDRGTAGGGGGSDRGDAGGSDRGARSIESPVR